MVKQYWQLFNKFPNRTYSSSNIPSGGGNWRLGRNLTLEARQISCVIEDSGEHKNPRNRLQTPVNVKRSDGGRCSHILIKISGGIVTAIGTWWFWAKEVEEACELFDDNDKHEEEDDEDDADDEDDDAGGMVIEEEESAVVVAIGISVNLSFFFLGENDFIENTENHL